MNAFLKHHGFPGKLNRNDVLLMLEDASPKTLGLSFTQLRLLKLIIRKCRKDDFRKGCICGTWESPSNLANQLQIHRRVLDNAERRLELKGWIIRSWSKHGPRAGGRSGGAITFLRGLNLAPLVDRFSQLVLAKVEATRLEQDAVEMLRIEIGELWEAICREGDTTLLNSANAILPAGRKSRISNKTRLESLKRDLEALLATISPVSGAAHTSDRSEISGAPTRPKADSHKIGKRVRNPEDRNFAISPESAVQVASPDYQMLIEALGGPSWATMLKASETVCRTLGIEPRKWGDACRLLGTQRASLCILVIDRNSRKRPGPGQAKDPTACLLGMAKHYRTGFLDLKRHFVANIGNDPKPEDAATSTAPRPSDDALHVGKLVSALIRHIEVERKP